jgi:hypothetical protein
MTDRYTETVELCWIESIPPDGIWCGGYKYSMDLVCGPPALVWKPLGGFRVWRSTEIIGHLSDSNAYKNVVDPRSTTVFIKHEHTACACHHCLWTKVKIENTAKRAFESARKMPNVFRI